MFSAVCRGDAHFVGPDLPVITWTLPTEEAKDIATAIVEFQNDIVEVARKAVRRGTSRKNTALRSYLESLLGMDYAAGGTTDNGWNAMLAKIEHLLDLTKDAVMRKVRPLLRNPTDLGDAKGPSDLSGAAASPALPAATSAGETCEMLADTSAADAAAAGAAAAAAERAVVVGKKAARLAGSMRTVVVDAAEEAAREEVQRIKAWLANVKHGEWLGV